MIRWQDARMKQFSYVNYLVLTFALATLGFSLNWLSTENGGTTVISYWHWTALLFFMLSIIVGLVCACIRLFNFGKIVVIGTVIYNMYEKIIPQHDEQIDRLDELIKKLNRYARRSLVVQIVFFVLGLACIASVVTYDLYQGSRSQKTGEPQKTAYIENIATNLNSNLHRSHPTIIHSNNLKHQTN